MILPNIFITFFYIFSAEYFDGWNMFQIGLYLFLYSCFQGFTFLEIVEMRFENVMMIMRFVKNKALKRMFDELP